MPIKIHGKEYEPVDERLKLALDSKSLLGTKTEVLNHTPVVIKVTITTKAGQFDGISAANPNKTIEKQSPYEVAETSALGRALKFAGFSNLDGGIASADEMRKVVEEDDGEPF